jgi:tetrahydromethanopterin S-methyltransferase subunit E
MMKLLILIVVVLGVMAIAQLARVYELTARLRGKREEDISAADNRMNARLMWAFLIAYHRLLPVAGHGLQATRCCLSLPANMGRRRIGS